MALFAAIPSLGMFVTFQQYFLLLVVFTTIFIAVGIGSGLFMTAAVLWRLRPSLALPLVCGRPSIIFCRSIW
jgi:hypothetical protein